MEVAEWCCSQSAFEVIIPVSACSVGFRLDQALNMSQVLYYITRVSRGIVLEAGVPFWVEYGQDKGAGVE